MAEFTRAPAVETIANQLIPGFFKDLLEHRVHIEYVFSDQKIERNGKQKWGECMKKGALDRLLIGDELDDPFDPLTFVCVGCRRWRVEAERNTLEVGDKTMCFCDDCYPQFAGLDMAINKNIARLEGNFEKAELKESVGPPDHPGFFVIKMFYPVWARLREDQQEYLVYHELCHVGVGWDGNGDTKLFIVPHDIEEFDRCARRYGPEIKGDLRRFLEEANKHGQQELVLDDVADDREEAA